MFTEDGVLEVFDYNKFYLVKEYYTDSPCGENYFYFIDVYNGKDNHLFMYDMTVGHIFSLTFQRYLTEEECSYLRKIRDHFSDYRQDYLKCPYKMNYETQERFDSRKEKTQ